METNPYVGRIIASRKIDALKQKLLEKKDGINIEDLKALRDLCGCEDINTALMASNTVMCFVKNQGLPIVETISWFVSLAQSAKNIRSIVKSICELLIISVRSSAWETFVSSCGVLQHPLNLLLRKEDSWPIIEHHMKFILDESHEYRIFLILKPVFIGSLWSPYPTMNICCRRGIWKYLIRHMAHDSNFLVQSLSWLRIEENNCILDVNYFVDILYEEDGFIEEGALGNLMNVMFANLACNLAINGLDPERSLNYCKKLLEKYPTATDIILLTFSQKLSSLPISYLHVFIQSWVEIIKMNKLSSVSTVWIMIAALLPWLFQCSKGFENMSHVSYEIFTIAQKYSIEYSRKSYVKELLEDRLLMQYIITNRDLFWALSILRKIESCSANTTVDQMKKVFLSKEDVKDNCCVNLFISRLVLENISDFKIQRSCLDLLMKNNPGIQLPLILFLLSKTGHAESQLHLLLKLPLTAEDEFNMAPIFRTIESLSSRGDLVLSEISVLLHLEIWKLKRRSYANLSEIIWKHKVKPRDINYEMDVVIATAIREICSFEPSTHGEEWLPLLSDIMNRCSEEFSSRPLMDALVSILLLCEAEVVNRLTVFKALLDQGMFTDRRPEVVAKLCELVKIIFKKINGLNFDNYELIVVESLKMMWNFIMESKYEEIRKAAIDALSQFDVGLMPLKVLPENYRKNVKIPNNLLKKVKPDEAPENVFSYVPGFIWIKYLEDVEEDLKIETCTMMSFWLQTELSQLGRGFYRSIRGEPNDVSFLPDKSLFKAIVKFLKRIVVTNDPGNQDLIRTVTLCMIVLNNDIVIKIPLFNWSFLDYFFKYKNSELTREICRFLANESGTSTSAIKCIENYLKTLDITSCTVYELQMLLHLLPKLCCHLTPTVFLAVMEPTFRRIFDLAKNDKDLFRLTCDRIGGTLKESSLDEHNRDLVCRSVIKLWTEITKELENEDFEYLAAAIMQMPPTFIEHLVVTDQCNSLSWEQKHKFIKLMYIMSMNEEKEPFKWLNILIETSSTCDTAQKVLWVYLGDIVRKHRYHFDKWGWLLQFMNKVLKVVGEDDCLDKKSEFMCQVMIFSVVVSSSLYLLLTDFGSVQECMLFFPQAVRNITFKEISSQMIELLHFLSKSEKLDDDYINVFKSALIAMKYDNHLQKLSNWNKIISVF